MNKEVIGGSVLETEYLCDNLRLIRMIPYGKIDFIPGQAIALHFDDNKRFFYVTTPPEAATLFEIMVKFDPNDKISEFLFKSLKEGDDILMSGPYGNSFLKHDAKHITLIAAGVGISHFISMIRQIMQNRTNQPIQLIYSVKRIDELAFKIEMDNFAHSIGKLKIDYIVTNDPRWNGRNKRIDEIFLDNKLDKNSLFYIAGPSSFINDIINLLSKLGINNDSIFFDDFLKLENNK